MYLEQRLKIDTIRNFGKKLQFRKKTRIFQLLQTYKMNEHIDDQTTYIL